MENQNNTINKEELFRISIENMQECFGIYSSIRDNSGRILDFKIDYVNKAACIGNQMTKEEQIGKSLLQIFPAHKKTGLFEEYCNLVKTGEPFIKDKFVYEDEYGGISFKRFFNISASKLGDGFVASWRDVTEQKNAEEKLSLAAKEWERTFNAIGDLIFVQDKDSNILRVNKACADALKMDPKDIIGKKCYEIIHHLDHPWLNCPFVKSLQDHVIHTEEINDPQLGAVLLVTVSPIFGADGELIGAVHIAKDISERKKVEEEKLMNLQDLKEANLKIREVQEQIIQSSKMASIGQLAGGVAHEINNPLTGVLNNVQLIKEIARQKEEFRLEDYKEILNIIEESAARCKKITQALLNFSHASTGAYQPVSLNEIMEEIYTLISQELRLQNISIQMQLQPDLPLILGDVQLLQQVILGFVSNAQWAIQKKSKAGGGTITIKIQYETLTKEVCFSVSDSGIGIPKENLGKIFSPFFTTKEVGEGTGLGLSIIYGIINAHRGKIAFESEFGAGTTFKVILPAISGVK